jgi:hypothetical protein
VSIERIRLFRPDGAALVRAAAEADYAEVTGADALEARGRDERLREAWHDFADLMRDVVDRAAELDGDDRAALAAQLDRLLRELRALGAEVWAVAANRGPGRTLHVEVRMAAEAPEPPRRRRTPAAVKWW